MKEKKKEKKLKVELNRRKMKKVYKSVFCEKKQKKILTMEYKTEKNNIN